MVLDSAVFFRPFFCPGADRKPVRPVFAIPDLLTVTTGFFHLRPQIYNAPVALAASSAAMLHLQPARRNA
jgi:hypothetical protein